MRARGLFTIIALLVPVAAGSCAAGRRPQVARTPDPAAAPVVIPSATADAGAIESGPQKEEAMGIADATAETRDPCEGVWRYPANSSNGTYEDIGFAADPTPRTDASRLDLDSLEGIRDHHVEEFSPSPCEKLGGPAKRVEFRDF